MSFGIYIHWPYCLSKCPYCDFYKKVQKNVPQEEIVSSYLEDLDFYYNLTSDKIVSSIFFGGGTPSLLSPVLIEKIINYIFSRWKIASNVEISLEANPNSYYPDMFAKLKSAGINRLSLGVQALNDDDLRFLGRTHNLSQAYQAIDDVLQNFDNHSIDLIYARPNQKIDNWLKELKQVISLGLKHISLYQLTIEENTPFYKKNVSPLDDEQAIEMYNLTGEFLQQHNYPKYEVSNYAQKGFESKHNLLYWTGKEYIGVGPSAHGRLMFFEGDLKQNSDARNSRTSLYAQVSALRDFTLSPTSKNIKSVEEEGDLKQKSGVVSRRRFYATTHRCEFEEISAEERAEELIIMGLRLVEGIDKGEFQKISGINFDNFVNKNNLLNLKKDDYIKENEHRIWVTSKGFTVLNYIIFKLLS